MQAIYQASGDLPSHEANSIAFQYSRAITKLSLSSFVRDEFCGAFVLDHHGDMFYRD